MSATSSGAAVLAIAAQSLLRFRRSKILWFAGAVALLPLLPMLLGADSYADASLRWTHYFQAPVRGLVYVHLLVASLLTAGAIAEEIEDKTYTYLWSRPIARWSVLAGKLVTGCGLALALLTLSILTAIAVTGMHEAEIILQSGASLFLGTVTVGCVSASLGILLPKHPLAAALTYFLVLDSIIGNLPFAAARISVVHNVVAIASLESSESTVLSSVLWLLGIAMFWGSIGLWRMSRNELSTGS